MPTVNDGALIYRDTRFSDEWEVCGTIRNDIKHVSIPDQIYGKPVTVIAEKAFKDCLFLKSITLGRYIDRIDNYAFLRCYKLESVIKHDYAIAMEIGQGAFMDCRSLYSFFGCIKSIEKQSFQNCVNLEKLFISGECYTVGDYAFDGCASLDELTFETNPILPVEIFPQSFYGARILSLYMGRLVNFNSGNILTKETEENFFHPETKISCPSWSNLTDFAYLGRNILIKEQHY